MRQVMVPLDLEWEKGEGSLRGIVKLGEQEVISVEFNRPVNMHDGNVLYAASMMLFESLREYFRDNGLKVAPVIINPPEDASETH